MGIIESYIYVENDLTKQCVSVKYSVLFSQVASFYEYPKELDDIMDNNGTKVYCKDGSSAILLMNYEEFKKQLFNCQVIQFSKN